MKKYITDVWKTQPLIIPQIKYSFSWFWSALHHGGGYRHVYYKPGVMLYNLQYVLGDDLFLKAMQDYFNTWKCVIHILKILGIQS